MVTKLSNILEWWKGGRDPALKGGETESEIIIMKRISYPAL